MTRKLRGLLLSGLLGWTVACGDYESARTNEGDLSVGGSVVSPDDTSDGREPSAGRAGTVNNPPEPQGGQAGANTVGGAGGRASTATGGASRGGASSACTTTPPVWSDCDEVGEFEPVAVDIPETSSEVPEGLEPLSDLSVFEEAARAAAQAQLSQKFESTWSSLKSTNCTERVTCTHSYGGAVGSGGSAMGSGGAPTMGSSGSTSTEEGADDRSGTNNQVVGVDEPDLMKLDDRYVYLVTTGKELLILDALEPLATTETSRTTLEGTPSRLLVSGDRALVIASTGSAAYRPCTYAYSCAFWGDGYPTLLTVFDITDRTNPVAIRRIELSSSLLSARMIDSQVHVVTSQVFETPELYVSYPTAGSGSSAVAALSAMQASYEIERTRLKDAPVTVSMPTLSDQVPSGDGWLDGPGSSPRTLHCGGKNPDAVLTVSSFDLLTDGGDIQQDMILSNPGPLFASLTQLYLAVPELKTSYEGYGVDSSIIHQFDLSGASSQYVASGRVDGHVLSQFSMDQSGDYLRVATSQGWVPDPAVHSAITVLERSGTKLVTRGKVDDLAPGEDIRAVRFVGDRGYVVTFKKTDPLFVLDMSEPTKPVLQGELKIPGFSTYIHPLDDTHLLTIGYDADDQGSFAYFDGIQLQIMDVTDAADPQLMFREVIGTRGSSSEALTDHLAFNYFEPKKMLAIPMTICEGGGDGTFGDVLTFTGLMVYNIDLTTGFSLHGRVPHPAPAGYYGSTYQSSCSTWWTDASSPVKRSAFVEDTMFSLGDSFLKVNSLSDLTEELARFQVGPVECVSHEDEPSCTADSNCQAISGVDYASATQGYVGCAKRPYPGGDLSCSLTTTCVGELSTQKCATLAHSCAPSGWVTLGSAECTEALCPSATE